MPRAIGKCLTRSRTSTSGSRSARRRRRRSLARRVTAGARRSAGLAGAQLRASTRSPRARAAEQARDAVARVRRRPARARARRAGGALAHVRAARVEEQPLGQLDQARRAPGDRRRASLAARARRGAGSSRSRPHVYGCSGAANSVVGRRALDDPPGVHHGHVVGHLGDDPEVVGDDARPPCRARAAAARSARGSAPAP